MNTKPNILIFTVYNRLSTPELNALYHRATLSNLKSQGIPAVELIDKVDGQTQPSILVVGFEHTNAVEKYATTFAQDSYLRSHNDRFTERVSLKKAHVEPVGYLKPISEAEAVSKGTYSFNPQNNTFYTLEVQN